MAYKPQLLDCVGVLYFYRAPVHMYEICLSPVTLLYVNLIIRPDKEPIREGGKRFSPPHGDTDTPKRSMLSITFWPWNFYPIILTPEAFHAPCIKGFISQYARRLGVWICVYMFVSVCVYMCVCVLYICVCMCICMSCVHIFVYLCVYIHKQVPVHVFVHIHVCANLNVWPVCKCVFSHVFLCAYAFLCAYICAVLPTYVLLCICEYMWVCTLSLYFQTYLHLSLFLKIAHNLIRQQDKPLVFDSIVSECIIHSAYK